MRYLFLLFFFVSINIKSQITVDDYSSPTDITICDSIISGIHIIDGNVINLDGASSSIDSSIIGLLAYWNATSENHVDSLTFNSTADTIKYISGTTVVLDDGQAYRIGNSMRFGNALSGTNYTILDTLGSRDSVILDQTCTASIGDELFIASGTLIDLSGNGADLIQPTGAYQPKTKWYYTDSASLVFDGIDDGLFISDNSVMNFGLNDMSIVSKGTWLGNSLIGYVVKRISSNGFMLYYEHPFIKTYLEGSTKSFNNPLTIGEETIVAVTFDRDAYCSLYINGSLIGSVDISDDAGNDLQSTSNFVFMYNPPYWSANYEFKYEMIYSRALTPTEILLYE